MTAQFDRDVLQSRYSRSSSTNRSMSGISAGASGGGARKRNSVHGKNGSSSSNSFDCYDCSKSPLALGDFLHRLPGGCEAEQGLAMSQVAICSKSALSPCSVRKALIGDNGILPARHLLRRVDVSVARTAGNWQELSFHGKVGNQLQG